MVAWNIRDDPAKWPFIFKVMKDTSALCVELLQNY